MKKSKTTKIKMAQHTQTVEENERCGNRFYFLNLEKEKGLLGFKTEITVNQWSSIKSM